MNQNAFRTIYDNLDVLLVSLTDAKGNTVYSGTNPYREIVCFSNVNTLNIYRYS